MNNLKFRAWHKEYKTMLPPFSLKDLTNSCGYSGNLILKGAQKYPWFEFHYDDFELMQFTGLKDKNGTDIYKGDIIKLTSELGEVYGDILEVYYHSDFCYWGITRYWGNEDLRWGDKIVNCLVDSCEFEVIGNIYENPELLEENHETI